MSLARDAFLHEVGHTLYNAPQLFGANGTTGNRFYQTYGWGLMQTVPTFYASNAWERWYLGWTELQTSNGQGGLTGSDIQDATSLTATSGYYTLRNYTTTGDVVRIKLPNTSQYLWLENHAKAGPCDRPIWQTAGDGQPFLPPPTGLLAMVEDMGDRDTQLSPFDRTKVNGLRTLSAEGSFDYNPGTLATWNNHLWDNSFYDMHGFGSSTPTPNPAGGQNQVTAFRWDRNGDGKINYDAYNGNGDRATGNETVLNARVNGTFTDGLLGPALGTRQVGFRYGLDTNPMLIPHQKFDATTQHLSEIPISGLSVEITAYNSATGDLTIRVRYNDLTIGHDTRWTGELRTYSGNGISIYNGVRLTIDRSATPQRSTLSSRGDFVNDTRLTIAANTYTSLYFASAAFLDLKGAGTTLYLEDGASVYVSGGGRLTAYAGTAISVNNRSDLNDQGQLVLKVGSTLTIRSTGQVINGTM